MVNADTAQTTADPVIRAGVSRDQRAAAKAIALKWAALFGLALTIVDKLEPLLKLAVLVSKLVQNWREVTHWFWSHVFALFKISPTPDTVVALNMSVLMLVIAWNSERYKQRTTKLKASMLWVLNMVVLFGLLGLVYVAQSMKYGYPVDVLGTLPPIDESTFNQIRDMPSSWWSKVFATFRAVVDIAMTPAGLEITLRTTIVLSMGWTLVVANQLSLFKSLTKIFLVLMVFNLLNQVALHAPIIRDFLN
jgi:hypothetical protein